MRLITLGLGAGATASHLVLLGLVPGEGIALSASPEWTYAVSPDSMDYSVRADDLTFTVERRQ